MTLPKAFIEDITPYLAPDELESFCHALTETEQTTCIRINKDKMHAEPMEDACAIGWNKEDGRYLATRPNFTLDPLMHAGCYYVQEASSQFVTHIVRHLIKDPVTVLDLCAAPGGKSTALMSALPTGSCLACNEIDRRRARILAENITKWGNPNIAVTSNSPADLGRLPQIFDLILTDVPCSGEGMFRKDEGAVKDWSTMKVRNCVTLQREILADIWPTLKPGGYLIYSTCTYNVHEDEEMLQYICEELGAEAVTVPAIDPAWNIHAPLKGNMPCYRFMPHYTRGEGLFMAAVRKVSSNSGTIGSARLDSTTIALNTHKREKKGKPQISLNKAKGPAIDLKQLIPALLSQLTIDADIEMTPEGTIRAIPVVLQSLNRALTDHNLFLLQSGIEMGTIKGRDVIPAHALALSIALRREAFSHVEIDKETALNYLRHEAITLPADVQTGYVILTYEGHNLGFVKNLGNRCNSLYPQEWRIRYL